MPDAAPAEREGGWWPALALCALVAAAYGQALGFDLVWDDHRFLVGNPIFEGPIHWQEIFTSPTSAFLRQTGGADRMDRPLLALSMAADIPLWGLRPAALHLTNILTHLAALLLLWRLARRLTRSGVAGFAVAGGQAAGPALRDRLHRPRAVAGGAGAAVLEPKAPERPWFLGQLLALAGRRAEAAEAYRAALALLAEQGGRRAEPATEWRRIAAVLPPGHRGEAEEHLRRLASPGGAGARGGPR